MSLELVRVKTGDGILLDGRLDLPEPFLPQNQPVDAWLIVHGTGSNFYSPGLLEQFAQEAVDRGQAALRINTRGHDIICTLPGCQTPMSGGAAFESISDCIEDIRTWIEELVRRGLKRVALVGHSMGGVKVIYSQAHDPHPNVVSIVGLSPPRFNHASWQALSFTQPFRDDFRRASELVSSGRGEELMLVEQPLPLWLTASSYVAKYGQHDHYDFVPLLHRLICPTLLLVGTESVASTPAFAKLPENVAKLQETLRNLHLKLVPGGNSNYSGQWEVPARLALDWVSSLTPAK